MGVIVAGRYRLGRRLGSGGQGTVHRAADGARGGAPVAVKLLPAGGGRAADLLRECDLLRSFDHPGLARALDGGRTPDGRAYLVTELVDGVPLSRALRRASDPRIGELVAATLEALAYLHGRGVLHRDLKPENVLVPRAAPATVKVLDFGFSAHAKRARGRPGTPGYAAPEVVAGRGAVPASDLYSLGVLLHRSLPRRPAQPVARLVRDALLPRCRTEDPARRFRDAQEALEAWRWAVGRSGPAPARPTRSGRPLGRAAELRAIRKTLERGGVLALIGAPGLGRSRLLEEAAFLAARAGRTVARAAGPAPADVLLLDDADRLPAGALGAALAAARAAIVSGGPDLAARLPAGAAVVRLAPLDRAALRAWAREVFRAAGAPARLAAAGIEDLRKATGGVPARVAAALERWLHDPGARPGPAPSAARARLTLPERGLLRALQALGRPLPAAEAPLAAGVDDQEAAAALERLETRGLLQRDGAAVTCAPTNGGPRAAPAVHARLAALLGAGRLKPASAAEAAGQALLAGDGAAGAEVVAAARREPVDERYLAAALSCRGVAPGPRHEALLLLADRRLREGRPRDVLALLGKGAERDPARRAARERRRAAALQRLGRAAEARRVLTRSLRAVGRGDPDEAQRLWSALGFLEQLAGAPREALRCARAGLELGERAAEAGALRNLEGIALYRLGDLPAATAAHRRAVRLFHERGLREDEAGAWTNLGNVWNARGSPRRATACHRRALRAYRAGGARHREEAAALNNLGLSLRAQGRWDEAREAFREALALRESEGDAYGAATCQANLATVLIARGDHEAALRALDRALSAFGPGGHRREESIARRHRARALGELNRRAEAFREARRALRLARTAALRVEAAEAGALVGELRARGGDLEAGLRVVEEAAAELERLGHPEGAAAARLSRAVLLLGEARAARAARREGAAARLVARARAGLPARGGPEALRARVVELLRELRLPSPGGGGTATVLARLVGIQRRLAAAEAPGRLLALLVDATRELTGARRGFVILRGAGGRRYEVVRAEGAAGPDDPFTELSRSVVEQVMDGGRSVVAESAFEDPRFRSNRSVSALGLRSILCIPIRVGGRTRGALYLDHPERPSLFRREDVHWLRAFADQAALILAERHQRRRIEALNSRLRRLLRRSTRELDRTRAALETATAAEVDRFQRMVGRSVALREVWRLVERIAPQAQPVLVLGETGTGKELVARALHSLGPRRGAPMVSVDCGALPEPLFESELFGHVRGGFTGAVDAAPGLFRAAHGGTLFLDEVGELALRPQAKLLRALESGEVRPVGGTATVRVDVRVIAATNRELEALVREGRFRADLFYRLNVLPIRLPPLRERPEDIPLLLSEFLSRTPGGPEKTFSKGALSRLLDYAWPGNVRELLNEVARLAAFPGSEVTAEMLSPTIRAAAGTGGATPEALRRASLHAERAVIEAALRQAGGNRSRAAKLLGVSRYGLYKKMLRCGIGS